MVCFRVAKIKLWMKGHHHYIYKYTIGKKTWIAVYSKKTKQRMKTIGHNPDGLAKEVDGLMSELKTSQGIDKTNGKHRDVPERTWVFGGGIDNLSIYVLYGTKVHKSNAWIKIKQCKRDLVF